MIKHKPSLAEHLLQTIRGILYGFVFIFPLFFLPFTLDLLEINKQTLLLLIVCIATLLWLGYILANKAVTFRLSLMLILPFLFGIALSISSWFSLAPFRSWVGSSGTEYTSVMTIAALCLLFYLITQVISEESQYNKVIFFLKSGSVLVGAVAILSLYGISLFPFLHLTKATLFNTVGTLNGLSIFLIVICVLGIGNFLFGTKGAGDTRLDRFTEITSVTLTTILCLETFFFLLAIQYRWLWFLLIFGIGTQFIFHFLRSKKVLSFSKLLLPVTMVVLALLFWIGLPAPRFFQIPVEVSPNFSTSSLILQKTFAQNSILFGTGPGTYAFDFAAYHSTTLNQTNFWNTRFDRAVSYILTIAPEAGIVGVVTYLLFVLGLCTLALLKMAEKKQEKETVFVTSLFSAWATIILASFLLPFNMTLTIVLFILSGLLASSLIKKEKTIHFAHSSILAFGSSALFILFTLILFLGIFLTTQRYVAEIAYTKAIRSDRVHADIKTLVSQLDRAATLNRFDDGAYRNLAEVLILRVNEELKSASTESTLNDQSRQYIQSLVAAAVNAAVHATDLSPHDVTNWLVLGNVYRSLSSVVPDATSFSRAAYLKATELDPNNPEHWMELGKTDLVAADAAQALTVAKDSKIAEESKLETQKMLDAAKVSFEKAIALKPNYDPAHFQLSLVYEREGKLDLAIGKIESVAKYNNQDVGVAFQLGVLYLKRNAAEDIDRAQNAFEHAVLLAPSYSNAHWYLASIYEKQGKQDFAIHEIETVLKLNPGNQLVKTRLDKLKAGTVETSPPVALDIQ